jgi:hypothetical protein
MQPNKGIFQDGLECAFLHSGSPIDNKYGTMTSSPHLHFQRWSWLMGFSEGLKMKMEQAAQKEPKA